jgi:hypothetical protein
MGHAHNSEVLKIKVSETRIIDQENFSCFSVSSDANFYLVLNSRINVLI